MKSDAAIGALSALAQPTRLDVFRMLVKQAPEGLPAGEIARRLDVPHNTMSTHLAILNRADLVAVERHSRSLIYRANLAAVRQLVLFLLKDCCNGQPELCMPLIQDLAAACAPGTNCCNQETR
jgi:ArsR family transcriptional regulator, arsenate/arsenite/antimonite-responsive transcriptional repressor